MTPLSSGILLVLSALILLGLVIAAALYFTDKDNTFYGYLLTIYKWIGMIILCLLVVVGFFFMLFSGIDNIIEACKTPK